jgi:CRP-like cAMP-binding protein
MSAPNKALPYTVLKNKLDSYTPISESSWQALQSFCELTTVKKNQLLYRAGDKQHSFAFVVSGLCRAYISSPEGSDYNKSFFDEGRFPGDMTALLTNTPARFNVEALEDSLVIVIDFDGYRELLHAAEDIKLFQIYYLEKHWLLHKDAREVQLVQEDAKQRYQRFLDDYAGIADRIPQYHIASHLGITPTQLSRIRKAK